MGRFGWQSSSGSHYEIVTLIRWHNTRPGADAGWRVLFAFQRPQSRATQGDCYLAVSVYLSTIIIHQPPHSARFSLSPLCLRSYYAVGTKSLCPICTVKRQRRTCMREILVMLSLVALVCSGCASIASHDAQGVSSGVNSGAYRGVREDWRVIAHAQGEETLGKPFCCLDVPFSLVLDTLWLPCDAIPAKTDSTATREWPETDGPQTK
jgi:uncharacterized protein YceK